MGGLASQHGLAHLRVAIHPAKLPSSTRKCNWPAYRGLCPVKSKENPDRRRIPSCRVYDLV